MPRAVQWFRFGRRTTSVERILVALLGRPGTDGFLEEALEGWISPVVESLTTSGMERGEARVVARVGIAVTRGLLLDLLASGDSVGATRAYELFLSLWQQAAAES